MQGGHPPHCSSGESFQESRSHRHGLFPPQDRNRGGSARWSGSGLLPQAVPLPQVSPSALGRPLALGPSPATGCPPALGHPLPWAASCPRLPPHPRLPPCPRSSPHPRRPPHPTPQAAFPPLRFLLLSQMATSLRTRTSTHYSLIVLVGRELGLHWPESFAWGLTSCNSRVTSSPSLWSCKDFLSWQLCD